MGQIQVFIWHSVEKDGGRQKIDDLRRANMALRAQTKQLKKEKYDLMQENKELKQANNLTVQTVVKSTRPAWGEAGVTQGVRTAQPAVFDHIVFRERETRR